MKTNYPTKFAIVSLDNSTEYVKTLKGKYRLNYCFSTRQIPHNGKRYKTYARALAMAEEINRASEHQVCKVIETTI